MNIKCKLCGGNLYFDQGSFSAKCDHCGISQFIFDYLDKDSEDYDEQVEIIKSQKEDFENTYLQFADDVINAKNYCHTSKDLKKAIAFFEKCGDYKDSPVLLSLAKKLFITKVASTSDCAVALKFLEEITDLTHEEKEDYTQKLSHLLSVYTVSELKEKGFIVDTPKETSPKNLLSTINSLLTAKEKNQESLSDIEKDIVSSSLSDSVLYIKETAFIAIKNGQNKEILCEIKALIPALKQAFSQLEAWDIESVLNGRIDEITERERLAAEEAAKKSHAGKYAKAKAKNMYIGNRNRRNIRLDCAFSLPRQRFFSQKHIYQRADKNERYL